MSVRPRLWKRLYSKIGGPGQEFLYVHPVAIRIRATVKLSDRAAAYAMRHQPKGEQEKRVL